MIVIDKTRPSETSFEAFESGEVIYECEHQIATLTFNRPKVHNALTFGMYNALYDVCERVDNDSDVRVLVLKGAGDLAFVAGTDIGQFSAFEGLEDALAYEHLVDRVVGRLDRVKKPVIAALHGYVVGGGAVLAAGADLRIGTPDFQFGVPIARTLGNCLNIRNYALLVDLIGTARAKELLFTARLVGAQEAQAIGLVNEIVDRECLDARVYELAKSLAAKAPITLRIAKESISRILAKRRIDAADDLLEICYTSDDFREGVDAFLHKRRPEWHGY